MTLANPQALVRRPSLGIAENSHADAGKKATAPRTHRSERYTARKLRLKHHTPMRKKKRSHGSERATATLTNPQAFVKGPSLVIAENSHADAGGKAGGKNERAARLWIRARRRKGPSLETLYADAGEKGRPWIRTRHRNLYQSSSIGKRAFAGHCRELTRRCGGKAKKN